jgi:radical SAM protein with 4Fe4S-binding SPASM domain
MLNFYKDYFTCVADKKKDYYTLVNKKTGDIFSINYIGLFVLKICETDSDENEIIRKTLENFNDINEDEVKDYIDQLINNSVLTVTDNTYPKKTFHIQWHINQQCNLRCKHCYQEEYNNKTELDFYEVTNIIDKYFDLIRKWDMIPEITFTGGEPLFRHDIFDIISYIKNKDSSSRIFILTNGTLVSEEIAYKLKKLGVSGVQISLDGPDQETHDYIRGTGNFQKAICGIKNLQNVGIWTSTHYVLMKENYKLANDFVKLASDLKINRTTFSRLVPIGNGVSSSVNMLEPDELKKTLEEIILESNKYPDAYVNTERDLFRLIDSSYGSTCPVGDNTLTILSDGTVLPCRRFPVKIGNIRYENFFEILLDSKLLNKMKTNTIDACTSCNLKDMCKGGCQGLAFSYFGEYMEKADPQCWRIYDKLPQKFSIDFEYDHLQAYYIMPLNEMKEKNLL